MFATVQCPSQHFKYNQHCAALPSFCTVQLCQFYRSWIRCWAVTILLPCSPGHTLSQAIPTLAAVGCLGVPVCKAATAPFLTQIPHNLCSGLRILYQRAESESSTQNCSADMLTCSINIWEQKDCSNAFCCPE